MKEIYVKCRIKKSYYITDYNYPKDQYFKTVKLISGIEIEPKDYNGIRKAVYCFEIGNDTYSSEEWKNNNNTEIIIDSDKHDEIHRIVFETRNIFVGDENKPKLWMIG